MERMNREQRRHESAPPQSAGHFPKNKKEKNNGESVKSDVAEMMSGGFQPVKLTIEHVRDPGERMPIGRVSLSERPTNPGQAYPTANLRIFVDVVVVIVIDEIVREGLPENRPCEYS